MARKQSDPADKAFLHCRITRAEAALLDDLVAFYEVADRTTLVKQMMRDYRDKMVRTRARRAKEASPTNSGES